MFDYPFETYDEYRDFLLEKYDISKETTIISYSHYHKCMFDSWFMYLNKDVIEVSVFDTDNMPYILIVIPYNVNTIIIEDKLTYNFPDDYEICFKFDKPIWRKLRISNYKNIDELYNLEIKMFINLFQFIHPNYNIRIKSY